ncbi:hypothetical protein FB567DRAFT_197988 [Paraphoma chrysanthemicola]|uniref:Uncharacterized protein n=1 Tax=Paraphoma chrysanthemicola TaxID=798071 RepID=A0A8K0VT96_9PLEO|nr:hypothetical protein FB567DRAFT_197988 [Paraphoma chrysanthemicola]
MAEIRKELAKIIDCPYPASLAHLVDLLARADVLTIRTRVHDLPPCSVTRLATLVYENLSVCAYALRALSSLSQSPQFRDALLLQYPGLLSSLLVQANSSSKDFDEYAGLCVLLLSRPLPGGAPLPASAQPFFLRTFENASQRPDVNTLRAVYSMLNGACGDLLRLLSPERRELFDQVLSHILSDYTTGQASMLLLWCFGIALIAERTSQTEYQDLTLSGCGQGTDVSTLSPEKQWKTAAAHKMFGSSSKMHKTIYMTYLSVIWALKGDVGVADDEAIEGIQIAIRTLQSVDQKTLQNWPRTNDIVKNTIPKLPAKLLRANNPIVQLKALSFYALAVGGASLPPEVVKRYELCLDSTVGLADASCLEETLSASFSIFSPYMQENFLKTLISATLDLCLSSPRYPQLLNHAIVMQQITKTLPQCTSLHVKVLTAATTQEVQTKIWNAINQEDDAGKAIGAFHADNEHQDLLSATISMLLVLALTMQPGSQVLPVNLTMALADKQRQLPHQATQCLHVSKAAEVSTLSLFQQNNTPYTGAPLQDWRGRLKSELESQGAYQRDFIVRSVAQICQDLEARCNTAEEPLLREQQRSQKLERAAAELNARVLVLESEATDSRFHLEGLEDEKLNLFDEKERLSTKVDELQADLLATSRQSADMSRKHQADLHAKDLELQSMALIHEENLRSQREQLDAQEKSVSELRREIEHISAQRASRDAENETLQMSLDTINQRLVEEVQRSRDQAGEIAQTKDRNVELQLQLQKVQIDCDTTVMRLHELQISHQELVHSSKEAYETLESKHALEILNAETATRETSESLTAQLQEALCDGRRADDEHKETQIELEQLQTAISSLEKELQELTEFCSEQEEELEELRALRKNVLAGLGLASQHSLPIRSTTRDPKEVSDLQNKRVSREHRRRKSAAQILDGASTTAKNTQGVTSTAMETIANASFASSDSQSSQNGPTPKRPKPRPSFKIPTMRTPRTQKPAVAQRSVSDKLSPSKRTALRQVSPNRRHTTVGFVVSDDDAAYHTDLRSARKRRGSLHGVHEADVDMDDFMAGTPMTPGNFATGTGRFPDDEDLTTTEL